MISAEYVTSQAKMLRSSSTVLIALGRKKNPFFFLFFSLTYKCIYSILIFFFSRLHYECLKMPLELVLFSPINTDFALKPGNEENILRVLYERLDAMVYEDNRKILTWDNESDELVKEVKKYLKDNQLFYMCPICVRTTSVNVIMDCVISRVLSLKRENKALFINLFFSFIIRERIQKLKCRKIQRLEK
jgi:hypothetical protein